MRNDEILIILEPGNNKEQYVLRVDSRISYGQLVEGIKHGLEQDSYEWKWLNTIFTCDSSDKDNKSLRELGFVTGTVLCSADIDIDKSTTWFFDGNVINSFFSKRHPNDDESTRRTMKYNITNRFITQMEETVIDVLSPGNPPRPGNNSIFDMIIPTLISFGTMYGLRAFFIKEANNGMMLFMGCSVLGTFLAQVYRYQKNKTNLKKARALWKSNYENYLNRVCQRIEDYQVQDVLYLKNTFPSMGALFEHIRDISGMVFFSRSVNDFDFMKLTVGCSQTVSSLFTIHHDVKEEIELGVTFYDDNGQLKINLVDEEPNLRDKVLSYLKKLKHRLLKQPLLECSDENGHNFECRYLNELSEYLAMERYRYLKMPQSTTAVTHGYTQENNLNSNCLPQNSETAPTIVSGNDDLKHEQPPQNFETTSTIVSGNTQEDGLKYEYPPLILDFKNCGALGCVGFGGKGNVQDRLLNHMILELAVNHNPQDLQFVFFFNPESDSLKKQERIQNYRCLPHFNELFDEVSQFVFDEESAGLVFSKLESIMNERMIEQRKQEEENISSSNFCQIVCIFEYDYKLKEKAFSKYLPIPPKQKEPYVNHNGLTFIFAVEYAELLPQFCGIILNFNETYREGEQNTEFSGTVQFRNQTLYRNMGLDKQNGENGLLRFENEYIFGKKDDDYRMAFARLSAFYSLHIQECGSVPDKVTLFDLYPKELQEQINSTLASDECNDAIAVLKEFIKSQWDEADKQNLVTKDLQVPIGKGESGNIYLDLHEKNHGPHMLVAGTTGSGKSEMMLTYLIGLCIRFSPQYLSLMLIDMKGNSFAGRLKELPHCVATVDNVSSEKSGVSPVYMLKRFLEILKAEIKRRELIFEEYGVDKLDDYIEYEKKISEVIAICQPKCNELKKQYFTDDGETVRMLSSEEKAMLSKQISEMVQESISAFKSKQQIKIKEFLEYSILHHEKKSPPILGHLVLVVDEFTELKRFGSETDTDYIGELTSIARVGRTLGLHMVLVSQNIENAITDDIRVNTRSRICLKVATRGASKEMLDGRADAYYSDMPPGRCYFLVGSGSTYSYFQSGYASENMAKISESQTRIMQLNPCGMHKVFYDSYLHNDELKAKIESQNKDNTQLNAVIRAISSIAEENLKKLKAGERPIYRLANSVFYQPLNSSLLYGDFINGDKLRDS